MQVQIVFYLQLLNFGFFATEPELEIPDSSWYFSCFSNSSKWEREPVLPWDICKLQIQFSH